jgi:hypothetical protein
LVDALEEILSLIPHEELVRVSRAWLDRVRAGSDGDGDHILFSIFLEPVVFADLHISGRAHVPSHEPVLFSLAGARASPAPVSCVLTDISERVNLGGNGSLGRRCKYKPVHAILKMVQ